MYGSDNGRAMALRSRVRGKMLMDASPVGPMLPRNVNGLPNANDARAYPDNQLFLAGGKRATNGRSPLHTHTTVLALCTCRGPASYPSPAVGCDLCT